MANELETIDYEQRISRSVMVWINTYTSLPVAVVNFEQLKADEASMAISTIQAAAVTRRFITGGHVGEYQFKIIYRIKPATSNNARLTADEVLDTLGAWAEKNPPTLGDGINVRKLEATTRSSLFAAYENGDEDHQIMMKLTYEVL